MNSNTPRIIVICTSSSGGNDLLPLRLDAPAAFDYGKIRPGDVVLLTAAISAPDICVRANTTVLGR